MRDTSEPNPYASPQRPALEFPSELASNTEILQAAEIELVRTQNSIMVAGWSCLSLAGLTLLASLFLLRLSTLDVLFQLLASGIQAVAGGLILRFANKIQSFARSKHSRKLDEVFIAQATFWKFLSIAIIAAFGLLIVISVGVAFTAVNMAS